MTSSVIKVLRGFAIAIGVIGYPVLADYSTTTTAATEMPALGVTVALAPSLVLLSWLGWRGMPRLAFTLTALAIATLLWATWPLLESNFPWVYFIQHIGTNIALGLAFGMTLIHERTPLVSRLAESVRGTLTPVAARYTRQVTLVWSLFFASITLLSTLFFFFASLDAWSFFANYLTLPLAIGLFVVEYLVRLRCLRNEAPHGFMDSLRAYWTTPRSGKSSGIPSGQ